MNLKNTNINTKTNINPKNTNINNESNNDNNNNININKKKTTSKKTIDKKSTSKKESKENNKSVLFNAVEKGESTDAKEKTENFLVTTLGKDNLISNNVYLISIIMLILLFVVILFLLSSPFRNGLIIANMAPYGKYQSIKSFDYNQNGSKKILDLHISSSFNSCNTKYKVFDYLHLDILKEILSAGARYIEVKVFNSDFGEDTSSTTILPIINNGTNMGEWKLCFTPIPFREFCLFIKKHAFEFLKKTDDNLTEGVPNHEDPLFLALDFKTNNNIKTLNKMHKNILDILGQFLLEDVNRSYTADNKHFSQMEMKDLKQKLVILSGDGFQGSNMTNIINGYWGTNEPNINHRIKRYHFEELKKYELENNKHLKDEFRKITNKQLTIVTPDKDEDEKGNIDMNLLKEINYDTKMAFDLGCQFISVYYQSVDEHMDDYITRFKNYGIIKKKNI